MKPNIRIGLLGGTFNPIHLGHLLIARDAMEQLHLDRVKFIPAALPPHKPLAGGVSATHRLRMTRLALRGEPGFEVDDIEIRRGGRSYSVETVAELKQRHPEAEFYFIIGADSLKDLHRWYKIERLARLCVFAVLARPGCKLVTPARLRIRRRAVRGHLCDIASRDIRDRLADGKSIRWLVPDNVFRYIQRQKLYPGKELRSSKRVS
jgi:nicotinate-nucleotide adenylyltransferase